MIVSLDLANKWDSLNYKWKLDKLTKYSICTLHCTFPSNDSILNLYSRGLIINNRPKKICLVATPQTWLYILMYFSLTEDSTTVLGFRCSSRDGSSLSLTTINSWTFDYLGVKQSAVTLRGQTARANSCTCVDLALQGSGLCRTTPRGDGVAAAPPGDLASVSVCRASLPP